jgi:hypothetical protein
MTAQGMEADLRNFADLLLHNQIAIVTNPVAQERVGARVRVTWRSSSVDVAPLTASPFASIGEYYQYVLNQAYLAILFDGALLQISFDFRGKKVVGHRLCYYPCPFEIPPEEFTEIPILDLIEIYQEAALDLLRLRSPLRFDYDPRNPTEGHPASHLHMIRSHCRCPVFGPVTLGHFIHFIFCYFYPPLWREHRFLRELPRELGEKTIMPVEEAYLHFGCSREKK